MPITKMVLDKYYRISNQKSKCHFIIASIVSA